MGAHNLCFEQKYEKYHFFLSEKFHSLEVKFSVYLIKHVSAMESFTLIFLLSENWPLTYSSLWTHSADDTLMIGFLCCQKTTFVISFKLYRIWHFRQIHFLKTFFGKNKNTIISILSSAENFTQHLTVKYR